MTDDDDFDRKIAVRREMFVAILTKVMTNEAGATKAQQDTMALSRGL